MTKATVKADLVRLPGGRYAFRGDEVEVDDEDFLERGYRIGSFVDPADLVESDEVEESDELTVNITIDGEVITQTARDANGDEIPVSGPVSDKVKDILAFVGEDLDRAIEWLGKESAKPDPRPSLVEKLEEIIADANDEVEESEDGAGDEDDDESDA